MADEFEILPRLLQKPVLGNWWWCSGDIYDCGRVGLDHSFDFFRFIVISILNNAGSVYSQILQIQASCRLKSHLGSFEQGESTDILQRRCVGLLGRNCLRTTPAITKTSVWNLLTRLEVDQSDKICFDVNNPGRHLAVMMVFKTIIQPNLCERQLDHRVVPRDRSSLNKLRHRVIRHLRKRTWPYDFIGDHIPSEVTKQTVRPRQKPLFSNLKEESRWRELLACCLRNMLCFDKDFALWPSAGIIPSDHES